MKKIFLLFLFSVISSMAAFSQVNISYPVFVLNDSFSHAQPKESKIIPQNYDLSNLSGFKIDCSKYDFSLVRSMNEGKNPDAVFIVGKSGNYMIELNATG